ncbi:glycosyltransferase [candidate division KSB1 bacterium]|nr:glycosyltransferase [candidate division KSB1 bacterium]
MKVLVIIPAFNEEKSIGSVLQDIPASLVSEVVVVNNNSTDDTANVARSHGATVLNEAQKGYGSACLTGINYAKKLKPDLVVFLDGDYSDFPDELPILLDEIAAGRDLVIGSRMLGNSEPGALLPQARLGNWLAVNLIRLFFGHKFTDLGPFRAIKWEKLIALEMADKNFGWTVEMQIKAVRRGLRISEVPVSYRKRIGVSKVTGTFSGTIKAGSKILFMIFKCAVQKQKTHLN